MRLFTGGGGSRRWYPAQAPVEAGFCVSIAFRHYATCPCHSRQVRHLASHGFRCLECPASCLQRCKCSASSTTAIAQGSVAVNVGVGEISELLLARPRCNPAGPTCGHDHAKCADLYCALHREFDKLFIISRP